MTRHLLPLWRLLRVCALPRDLLGAHLRAYGLLASLELRSEVALWRRRALLQGAALGAAVAAVGAALVPRGGWVVSVLAGAGAGLVTGAAVGIDLSPPEIVLLAAGAAGPAVVAAHLRGATGRAARTAPATLAALPCALAALPLWVLARILFG